MNKFFMIVIVPITLSQCQPIVLYGGITRLKNTVESVSSELEHYGNNLIFNTKITLNILKFQQMLSINAAVNKAVGEIRDNITAARNAGKDAYHCTESTLFLVGDVSITAFNNSDKCVDSGLASLNPVKNMIDAHTTRGKRLLSELDSIELSCTSGNHIVTQICIARKMPAASASVNDYEATAKKLKITGDSLSSLTTASVTRCFQQTMRDLESAISAARISANECIRNS